MFSLKRNTHLTSHLDLVSFLDRSNIGNAETAGMYVKIFTHVTVLLIASSLIERVPSTKLRTTATKKDGVAHAGAAAAYHLNICLMNL